MVVLLMAESCCTGLLAMDCPVPSVSQLFVSSQWGSCVSHIRNLADTDHCTTAVLTFNLHVIRVPLLAPPLGHIDSDFSGGCFYTMKTAPFVFIQLLSYGLLRKMAAVPPMATKKGYLYPKSGTMWA